MAPGRTRSLRASGCRGYSGHARSGSGRRASIHRPREGPSRWRSVHLRDRWRRSPAPAPPEVAGAGLWFTLSSVPFERLFKIEPSINNM